MFRRIVYILFTLAAGVSLVLLIVALLLWLGSYRAEDQLLRSGDRASYITLAITNAHGRIYVFRSLPLDYAGGIVGPWRWYRDSLPPERWEPPSPSHWGFQRYWASDFVVVVVPHWAVVVLAAPFPAIWLYFAWRRDCRRRRAKRGLCLACGYDLRGSPGACPECGEEAGADGIAVPNG